MLNRELTGGHDTLTKSLAEDPKTYINNR